MIQLLVTKAYQKYPKMQDQRLSNPQIRTSYEQSQMAHKFNFLIKMDSTFLGGLCMKNAGDKNQPKSVVQFPKSSGTIASGWEDGVLHEERRHDI